MSGRKLNEPDYALARFVGSSLVVAVSSIKTGTTLIPFGVVLRQSFLRGSEQIYTQFAVGRFEEGAAIANMWLEENKTKYRHIMVVVDGFITVSGLRRDALLVRAASGTATSFGVAASYRPGSDPTGFKMQRPLVTIDNDPSRAALVQEGLREGWQTSPLPEARQFADWD
jgi:hypothetical protein